MENAYQQDWEIQEGRSLYRYTVLAAPDAGGAREIIYQGPSLEVARLVAASPKMYRALRLVEALCGTGELRLDPKARQQLVEAISAAISAAIAGPSPAGPPSPLVCTCGTQADHDAKYAGAAIARGHL